MAVLVKAQARLTARRVSGKKAAAAPRLVSEPISSLSKMPSTWMAGEGLAIKKPWVQAKTQARSSSRGPEKNSPCGPQITAFWPL